VQSVAARSQRRPSSCSRSIPIGRSRPPLGVGKSRARLEEIGAGRCRSGEPSPDRPDLMRMANGAKPSFCSATEPKSGDLAKEAEARQRIGLPSRLIDRGMLRRHYGIDRRLAIRSHACGEIDPVHLAASLIGRALRRGARLSRRSKSPASPCRRAASSPAPRPASGSPPRA
jgi:hypothetical protein